MENQKTDRVVFGEILINSEECFIVHDRNGFSVKPGSGSVFHLSFNDNGSFRSWGCMVHPETKPGSRILLNEFVGGTDQGIAASLLQEYLTNPEWPYKRGCEFIKKR